jgi:hypothetical protein
MGLLIGPVIPVAEMRFVWPSQFNISTGAAKLSMNSKLSVNSRWLECKPGSAFSCSVQ